jgi:hypothetical protein
MAGGQAGEGVIGLLHTLTLAAPVTPRDSTARALAADTPLTLDEAHAVLDYGNGNDAAADRFAREVFALGWSKAALFNVLDEFDARRRRMAIDFSFTVPVHDLRVAPEPRGIGKPRPLPGAPCVQVEAVRVALDDIGPARAP